MTDPDPFDGVGRAITDALLSCGWVAGVHFSIEGEGDDRTLHFWTAPGSPARRAKPELAEAWRAAQGAPRQALP